MKGYVCTQCGRTYHGRGLKEGIPPRPHVREDEKDACYGQFNETKIEKVAQ